MQHRQRWLACWLVSAAAGLASATERTVQVTIQGADGAPMPGVRVVYDDSAGNSVKGLDLGGGVAILEGVGPKVVLELEHASFGWTTTELALPDAPKVSVLVEISDGEATAKVASFVPVQPATADDATFEASPALKKANPANDLIENITSSAHGPTPRGGGETCASAEAISGGGLFAFTLGATTDGAGDAACDFFGNNQIFDDTYFCWTAGADGNVTIETCGLTGLDTKIAVYDSCGCPEGAPIACNDDSCSLQSSVTFAATNGNTYLVRIGTFSDGAGGSGQFRINAGGGGGAASDDCGSAGAISGEGTFPFDNTAATTDGLDDPLCDAFGTQGIDSDVWYCWTAECDGNVTVQTCGLTGVDTKVAAYDGCGCPTGAGILACNDDTCGLQSLIQFEATAGNQYLLRIGTFPGAAGGTGSIQISCVQGQSICDPNDAPFCQSIDTANASQSNSTAFTSADDFFTGVGGGAVTDICWWGAYLPATGADHFEVRYYDDNNGIPGALIGGPFSQDGGSLTVGGPVDTGLLVAGIAPIWEYTGSHAPVAVSGSTCYWIEVRNNPTGATWFWEWSQDGNGRKVVDAGPNGYDAGDIDIASDFAWCMNVETGDAGGCLPPPPTNDDCGGADAIAGEGVFGFNNGDATTDGPEHATCAKFGLPGIDNDVWFCWTAPCDARAIVETCGLTGVDTKIAAYDGCACPVDDARLLACNDDTCGLQSRIAFDVIAGNQYLIRIGTFPGAAGGAGSFSITCQVVQEICTQPDENCQDIDTANASQSNSTAFTSADDFVPAVSGDITSICWWGAYLPAVAEDFFEVRYYDDNGGIPGALIGGPFTQSGGSLTVAGPVDTGLLVAGIAPIWEFTGDHAPVSVTGGTCYWIEVRNNPGGGATWFWEWSQSGNGRKVVDAGPNGYDPGDIDITSDFAWCINLMLGDPAGCLPPPPTNDDCAMADAIAGEGTFGFNNSDATQDGPDHATCAKFGLPGIDNDVWFCWTAPCTSDVVFETCGLTAVDTKIAVYEGCECPATDARLLACNDDTCGLQSQVIFSAVAGQEYLLRLGTFPGAAGGVGAFSLACIQTPENDLCENAIPIGVPSVTNGSTDFATIDSEFPTCVTTISAAGVWYSVIGTGNTMTAETCGPFFDYDTKLNIYCGDCNEPVCVTGNDDDCPDGANGLLSTVTWCSQPGAEYLILVQGFGGQTGAFELIVSDDGAPCSGGVQCIALGACCLPDGTCVNGLSAADCDSQGGAYQGDGSNCAGGFEGYTLETCNSAFEDISGFGTQLALSDDSGLVVSLGFTFNFFGDDHTTIGVSSNGYLTFGASLTDLSNDPIPSSFTPNDMIAMLWDDLNPAAGGSVHVATLGSAPNRRFICQFTNVPQFGGADMNTFQGVLFEGSNCIELRYEQVTPEAFAGDYTAGVENQDGSDGVAIDTSTLGGDECFSLCPSFSDPIDCPSEGCDSCPAGTIPLVDAQGDFAGWCLDASANIGVFVDAVEPGFASIEITKDFTQGPEHGGFIPPILIDFVQVCPDDLTANMIFISDEAITNQTGVAWTDFHWVLFDGPEAWFDIAASAGFSVAPFTTAQFEDLIGANQAKKLNAFGGTVPHMGSFFPGAGAGELKIGIDLSGSGPVSFTLKERPTIDGTLRMNVDSNNQDVPIQVAQVDMYGDGSGAANFTRYYNAPTTVTLTAPRNHNGRTFMGWRVDGVMQNPGARTIDVDVDTATQVKAVYMGQATAPAAQSPRAAQPVRP